MAIILTVSDSPSRLWIPIFAVFTLTLGINLLLFTNHYFRLNGKILQLSKGNSSLFYGDTKGLLKYSKTEISEVEVINANNPRSPFNGFYVFKIKFKSGEVLRLSNIFVHENKLEEKFSDCRLVTKTGFAII